MSATELVRYDAMCHAIAAAYEVDEVKDIRDKALALEVYSRQAHNTEAERQACEIRLRAERKAGQLLREMEKAKGGNPSLTPRGSAKTLGDLGITYDQSSNWQKLADVPDEQFETALAGEAKPTTNGIIAAAAPKKVMPVASDALWLWGRLRDFQRGGLLDKQALDVLTTMTPEMRDDVYVLAPLVAAWLRNIGEADDCGIKTERDRGECDRPQAWSDQD